MRVEEKNKSKNLNKASKNMPKYKNPSFKPRDMSNKTRPGPFKPGNAPFNPRNRPFNQRNAPFNPKKKAFNSRGAPFNPKRAAVNSRGAPFNPGNGPLNLRTGFSSMKGQFKPWNQNINLKKNVNHTKAASKETFLLMAKRCGESGKYGYGAKIDSEQHSNLINVLESMQKIDLNCADMTTIANKFLKRIIDEEILLASSQVGAKTLMDTISFAGPEELEHLFEILTDNLSTLNMYASRVFVRLIETAFLRAVGDKKINEEQDKIEPPSKKPKTSVDRVEYNITEQFSQKHRNKCSEFIKSASQLVLENLELLVGDLGGSYIVCQCVLSLVGLFIPNSNNTERVRGFCELDRLSNSPSDKRQGILFPNFQVPSDWIELMKKIVVKVGGLPKLPELPYMAISSISLQYVGFALSHVDKKAVMDLYKKLLRKAFIDVDVSAILARETKQPLKSNKQKEESSDEEEEENSKEKKETNSEEDEEENSSDKEEENNSEVDEEQVSNEEEEENSDDDEQKVSSDDRKEDSEEDKEVQSDDDQVEEVAKIAKNDSENLPSVFAVSHSRKLLTLLMVVGGPELLLEIYKDLLAERFMELAMRKGTDHVVQSFLYNISDKALFKSLCKNLLEHMESLAATLINAISGACARLNTKQKEFMVALKKYLNLDDVDKEKALFACVIQMKPYENKSSESIVNFNNVGSRIVQSILHFNDPNPMVNCILRLPPTQLSHWTKTPVGSFVSSAFLTSKTINSELRKMYIDRLRGQISVLAVTQLGCNVVKEVFAAGNTQQKLRIVKELIEDEKIQKNEFGRLLWNTFKINMYTNDPKNWHTLWSDENETVSPKTKLGKSKKANNDETVSAATEFENELKATPKSKGKKTVATPKTGGNKKTVTPNPEDPEINTPKHKGNKTPMTPKLKKKNIAVHVESEENGTTASPKSENKKTKAIKRPAPA